MNKKRVTIADPKFAEKEIRTKLHALIKKKLGKLGKSEYYKEKGVFEVFITPKPEHFFNLVKITKTGLEHNEFIRLISRALRIKGTKFIFDSSDYFFSVRKMSLQHFP